MFQNRCEFARFAPKNSEKIRANRRRTPAKRAAQVSTHYRNVFCVTQTTKMSLRRSCKPCARVALENSAKIHRNLRGFRRKNRAHFRRASHRTITKIIFIDAGPLCGPSVDRVHVLQSLRVRGALICCQNRCKIARFVPKNSEKIRANRRRTHAKRAAQAAKHCWNVSCPLHTSDAAYHTPCMPCARVAVEISA